MTKALVRTSDDLPRDHWMARQLPAGTSLRSFAEDEAISVLTSAVQVALDDAGLSRAEIAEQLGTTRSYVSQLLNGSTNMTLKTLGALYWVAGQQVAEVRSEPLGLLPTQQLTAQGTGASVVAVNPLSQTGQTNYVSLHYTINNNIFFNNNYINSVTNTVQPEQIATVIATANDDLVFSK
jgi:transcriptional regulator with XRE-family HTH domain